MRIDGAVALVILAIIYSAIIYALLGVRTTDPEVRLCGCGVATAAAAGLGRKVLEGMEE